MFKRAFSILLPWVLVLMTSTNINAKGTQATDTLRNAWQHYYQTIDDLRQLIEATPRFEKPEHRAKGYHSLLEAQAMAYRMTLPVRAENPLIHTRMWYADVYTLGGNSPDFYYGATFLDGTKSYKISGRFGEQKMVIMQGYSHVLGHKDSTLLGNFDFSEFALNDDGTFTAIISATKHEGNWIPLDPSSKFNFFFLRRAVDDWHRDVGDLSISALDETTAYDELDELLQAERILLAADLMRYLIEQWTIGIYDLYLRSNDNEINQLAVIGGETIAEDRMGSPSTYYMWGVYQIEADEALIIEYDKPEAVYWSFQVFDVWCKPVDFVNHQTDVNMHRAAIDDDGKVRYVLSHQDIGIANWLDPVGRKEGTLVGRNYLAKKAPNEASVKKVKLAEVLQHLPKNTAMVSPEQRRQALEYRRQGYLTMTGEM